MFLIHFNKPAIKKNFPVQNADIREKISSKMNTTEETHLTFLIHARNRESDNQSCPRIFSIESLIYTPLYTRNTRLGSTQGIYR